MTTCGEQNLCLITGTLSFHARIYFLPLAFTLAGSFLLICGYFGTSDVTAVLFLTIAVGSLGLALSGFNCNHLDIAPRYGGVLMGLSNMMATIPGIVGPYVAKAIAHQVQLTMLLYFRYNITGL